MFQFFPEKEGNMIYLVGRNQVTVLGPQLLRCRTPGGQPVQPGQQRQLSLWHVQSYMGIKTMVSRESFVLIPHRQANLALGGEMSIMTMAQHLE